MINNGKLLQEEHDARQRTRGGDRKSEDFSRMQNEFLKSEAEQNALEI